MTSPLENKLVLITGATRGIGQAIAIALGKQGATVIGTATSDGGVEKIQQTLTQNNIQGQGYVLNVADENSVNEVISKIQKEQGKIDILVNNAAINRDNLMLRMKPEEWDDIINTNLSSIYRVSKACLRDMVKARWGRIINISSVVGCSGNPGQANYAAAKAGMIGFSKSLAMEIATRGITVNCVAPGFIETRMTESIEEKHRELLLQNIPMGRMGQPEEIAATVAFLASADAAYITGQTIHVNGGMYMP